MKSAKLKGQGNKLSAKLTKARKNEAILQKLASDIKILLYWLRIDILSLAGSEWAERMELMNFIIEREGRRGFPAMTNRVVEELQLREDQGHNGIKALRTALSNQKSDLLAFALCIRPKTREDCPKFSDFSFSSSRSLFVDEEIP